MAIAGVTSLYGTSTPRLQNTLNSSSGALSGLVQTTALGAARSLDTGTGQRAAGPSASGKRAASPAASSSGTFSSGTSSTASSTGTATTLESTDQTVRTRAQAQMSLAGAYGGTVTYSYRYGADGSSYAVAATVAFDVSPVAGDPAATIAKMQTILRAALASGTPSASDMQAAAAATRAIAQAEAELRKSAAAAIRATKATVLQAQEQSGTITGPTAANQDKGRLAVAA